MGRVYCVIWSGQLISGLISLTRGQGPNRTSFLPDHKQETGGVEPKSSTPPVLTNQKWRERATPMVRHSSLNRW